MNIMSRFWMYLHIHPLTPFPRTYSPTPFSPRTVEALAMAALHTKHAVRFAGASLAESKHAHIVALEQPVDKWQADLLEYSCLLHSRAKDVVEDESRLLLEADAPMRCVDLDRAFVFEFPLSF